LAFVGLKMVWLNDLYDGKFPITWSLGIIAVAITISVVVSILIPAKDPDTSDQAA
jgi:tellurite resistance protein TerC